MLTASGILAAAVGGRSFGSGQITKQALYLSRQFSLITCKQREAVAKEFSQDVVAQASEVAVPRGVWKAIVGIWEGGSEVLGDSSGRM